MGQQRFPSLPIVKRRVGKTPDHRESAEPRQPARYPASRLAGCEQQPGQSDRGGLRVEAVNAAFQRAQIGHALAERAAYGAPVGAVYRSVGRRVDVSLYSIGDFDVAAVAAKYGGGGHRNAAGFSVPLEAWTQDFA